MSDEPRPEYGAAVQDVKAASNGKATASLVLGIIAILISVSTLTPFSIWAVFPPLGLVTSACGVILAVIAVVLGHRGLRQSRGLGLSQRTPRTGLVLGYLTIAITVLTPFFWFIEFLALCTPASGCH